MVSQWEVTSEQRILDAWPANVTQVVQQIVSLRKYDVELLDIPKLPRLQRGSELRAQRPAPDLL
jgi:hypothetical protein